MLDRDDNGRREGLNSRNSNTPQNADGSEPTELEEPIEAEFADSPGTATHQVRTYLERADRERAEPIFQAELADVSPTPPNDATRGETPQFDAGPIRRNRRVMLPVILFLLTCLSTFIAGACGWWPADYLFSSPQADGMGLGSPLRRMLSWHWNEGLIYMVCVLAILFTHEMGHFLATVRYRIPASLPFFLPLPIAPLGTLGAVIAMDGRVADRKQTFDIGIAGPLAGLVVALPVLWVGVGNLDMSGTAHGMFQVEPPLIAKWMLALRQPAGYVQGEMIWQSQLNPFLMAGWFGMIITGLNMMPVSQLDGGHVTYTLFGKRAHWIARGFIVLTAIAMAFSWVHSGLFVMILMILFIGVDHPQTSDDSVPLGPFRTVLGYASLAIPVLCFAPKLFIT